MKVSTGVFTHIEVDVDEWETDKARFFKVTYPKGISDSVRRDIIRHMMNHHSAYPKNGTALKPRIFVMDR